MTDDGLRDTIEGVSRRFDLGEYEVSAYLTVLDHGQLTASEIADDTDIPQPRVYDTVRGLADRGLVELRESRPMTVVAVDPQEALADVQTELEDLIAGLEARYTAPGRQQEAAALVRSRSTILRHFEEVIREASFELSLSVTPDLLHRFEGQLAAAVEDGVSVDLLVTPDRRAPDPAEFDYSRVCSTARSRRGITTPVLAVADGEYSIYATQDALGDDQDRYGVLFNRSALGFLVSGFFGTVLWTTTERTLHEDAGRVPASRYASIRRCVKDLMNSEGEFYATVEGRDVETGNPQVVRGRVVDVVLEKNEEVAGLSIETEEGVVSVGGRVAAYEDVEAHVIRIGRDVPPDLE